MSFCIKCPGITYKTVGDIRDNSGMLFRPECKPTISSLDEYEVSADIPDAGMSDFSKTRFVYGNDEAFVLNGNWANAAANVEISSDGLDKYNQQADFLSQKIVISSYYYETKFNYDLNRAMEKKFIEGNATHSSASLTIEEWGNCLLSTFAKTYDEIVTGYQSGTRELYVVDENEESGYRRLTMEEELDNLMEEMHNQVNFLDRLNEAAKFSRAGKLEIAYSIQLSKYNCIMEDLEEKIEDKYIERLKEKLLHAVNVFTKGYQDGDDINDLLGRITIKKDNNAENQNTNSEAQSG